MMKNEHKTEHLNAKIDELTYLNSELNNKSLNEKIKVLNNFDIVKNYLPTLGQLNNYLKNLSLQDEYLVKSVLAIGQSSIFDIKHHDSQTNELFSQLLKQLLDIEQFYRHLGGIIGYHLTVLKLIVNHYKVFQEEQINYLHPEGLNITHDSSLNKKAIKVGLENMNHVSEIYPIGGAGDRLNLIDEKTKAPLPAALLPFQGRTLLEGLMRDLQAREYLYFKVNGTQLYTPLALMTSTEKNNYDHITHICKEKRWFGRPQNRFFLFVQPLVPVVTVEGNWSSDKPLHLILKPGGHGVIWKLAEDRGVFNWLAQSGYDKALVRQINNPIAGTDQALFALIGVGCMEKKALGFLSCERLINSAEGTNVILEKETKKGYEYSLTNIEYTDFSQKGISEAAAEPGSVYSAFPANTNILFVDIPSIRQAIKNCPIPGQIINMKNKVAFRDLAGKIHYTEGGRLESTMQNIADQFTHLSKSRLKKDDFREALQTYLIYNKRSKTISPTKQSYKKGESLTATPEQAFYDLQSNNWNLLRNECDFKMSILNSVDDYLKKGPNLVFLYHPALGPLYSVIKQKIRKGNISNDSELQLEIAEVDVFDLSLNGCLLIESTSPLGFFEGELLRFGKESRCHLHHVSVINRGINRQAANTYWKNEIERHESMRVLLHEGAEFFAEHVQFKGNHFFEVPPHHRLIVRQNQEGRLEKDLQAINKPSWQWQYQFDDQDNIRLSLS